MPDEIQQLNVLRSLEASGRVAAIRALAVSVLVGLAGLAYYTLGQSTHNILMLEFRPTFAGAAEDKYPNGLPFSPQDILAPSVLDSIFDQNSIIDYCPREQFRQGFYIEKWSDLSAPLDADFQARLAEPRLTVVERERTVAEYQARRAALPLSYRLVFVRPAACAALPPVILSKAVSEVLPTWATQSEINRGVVSHNIDILTPAVLDVEAGPEASSMVKADLVRENLQRVLRNIGEVAALPGAVLVRTGTARLSLPEIRNRLTDFQRSRVEPLVVLAGQAPSSGAQAWIETNIAALERQQRVVEGRARANQEALQQYSGTTPAIRDRSTTGPGGSSDVQTLMPQIDGTFIDRLLELSEAHVEFRQGLVAEMVEAKTDAAVIEDRGAYYKRLAQAIQSNRGAIDKAEIDRRLAQVILDGKEIIAQFNDLYTELSRVSLRAASSLYQLHKPITSRTYREFTTRELAMIVVVVFFAVFLVSVALATGRDWLRGMSSR